MWTLIGMMFSAFILFWLTILTIVVWKEMIALAKAVINETVAFFK